MPASEVKPGSAELASKTGPRPALQLLAEERGALHTWSRVKADPECCYTKCTTTNNADTALTPLQDLMKKNGEVLGLKVMLPIIQV